jgi:hypothetical protein
MPKLAQPGGAIVVSGDIVVSAVSQALLFLEHDLHCQPMYTSSGSCTAKDALFRLRSQVVGHYLEAIRIDPYFSDAYSNLGNAYRCALCCARPVLHAWGGRVRLGRLGVDRVARQWLVNVLVARRVAGSGWLQEILLRSVGRLIVPRVGISG